MLVVASKTHGWHNRLRAVGVSLLLACPPMLRFSRWVKREPPLASAVNIVTYYIPYMRSYFCVYFPLSFFLFSFPVLFFCSVFNSIFCCDAAILKTIQNILPVLSVVLIFVFLAVCVFAFLRGRFP